MKKLKISRKRKLKNYLKIGMLAFGLLLTLTNCENESDFILEDSNNEISKTKLSSKKTSEELNEISTAKQWFEQNSQLNEFNIFEYSTSIDWNDAFLSIKNGKSAIEIPITLKENINIAHKEYETAITFNRLLILKSKNGDYKSYIVNFLKTNNPSDFKNKLPKLNYFKIPESFNGYITVINNQNKIVQKIKFENGKHLEKKKEISSSINSRYETPNIDYTCVYWGWWYEDGTFEIISLLYCYGSGGGSNDSGADYPDPENPDHGSPGNDYSDNNGCPDGYIIDPDDNCIPEVGPDKIIDNLTGKADCVFQKLINIRSLSKTLEKFMGERTAVHLILNEGDIAEETVSGETYYGTSFYITIKLDSEHMNSRPALYGALVILHEAIHAEIYRNIKTTSGLHLNSFGQWELGSGAKADFPTLFNYYDNYPQNPNHNYMADYYREAMETGLKEFANSIGKTYSDQLIKDLVWAGLHNTNAWDNMYADPVYTENEQKRILNVLNEFIKSEQNDCK